jgi:hypothetical protein
MNIEPNERWRAATVDTDPVQHRDGMVDIDASMRFGG